MAGLSVMSCLGLSVDSNVQVSVLKSDLEQATEMLSANCQKALQVSTQC